MLYIFLLVFSILSFFCLCNYLYKKRNKRNSILSQTAVDNSSMCYPSNPYNSTYFIYKPHIGEKVKNPLVWGFAGGYSWEKMELFVVSLRKSGYIGDLVMGISIKSYKHIKDKLKEYKIKPILIEDDWPFYSSENKLFPIGRSFLKKCSIEKREYGDKKWNVYRYSVMLCWLLVYGNRYSHIMNLDVRDVVFQGDPFDWNFEDGMYIIDETKNDNLHIKDSVGNLYWVEPYKNYKRIICNKALNSGTILGSRDYFISFVKQFCQFIKDNYVNIAEQGSLNYAYYTGYFKNIKFLMNRNEKGVVLSLALDFLTNINIMIAIDTKNYTMYNEDGTIPLIVHQYDRYKHFVNIFQIRYYGKIIEKKKKIHFFSMY